jgi:alkaline phosphatase
MEIWRWLKFFPPRAIDPEETDYRGERGDRRNIVEEWRKRYNDSAYVWNKQQFDAIDPTHTGHLMGLFDRSYMQYEADRTRTNSPTDPSLAEMTLKAIDITKAMQHAPWKTRLHLMPRLPPRATLPTPATRSLLLRQITATP